MGTRVIRLQFIVKLVAILMLAVIAEGLRVPVLHKRQNTTKALIYVTCGIIVFVAVLVLGYFARELCPRGPIFTSIELDEIRIDRLDDIETGLRKDINTLKDKLAFHRKKKTQVQTDRDIKRRLGERVERFNSKGREIYGEAWDEGDIPVKDVVAMTTKEVEGLRREAEVIAQQRKQEEKEDLWKLWNEIRQDGDQNAPLLGTGKGPGTPTRPSPAEKGEKGRPQYRYSAAGQSMAESTRSMMSASSNGAGAGAGAALPRPYSSISRPVFELGNEGKFNSPADRGSSNNSNRGEVAPSTYTYNSSTYNINPAGSDNRKSASPMRVVPPVLDLSKLTSPPAHVKPPPTKPPGFASPTAGAAPSGKANSSPLKGSASSGVEPSAIDRSSQKPSMRSYAPGQRPAPPAGPKPPPRPNPDAPAGKGAAGTSDPNTSTAGGGGGSAAGGAVGTVGSVRTMKRPPPPLLAPPPGYIPGNSSARNNAMTLRSSARGSARLEGGAAAEATNAAAGDVNKDK